MTGMYDEIEGEIERKKRLTFIGKVVIEILKNELERKKTITNREVYEKVESILGRKLSNGEKHNINSIIEKQPFIAFIKKEIKYENGKKVIIRIYTSKIRSIITIRRVVKKLWEEYKPITLDNVLKEICNEYGLKEADKLLRRYVNDCFKNERYNKYIGLEMITVRRAYRNLSAIINIAKQEAYKILENRRTVTNMYIYKKVENKFTRKLTDIEKEQIIKELNNDKWLMVINIEDGIVTYTSKPTSLVTIRRTIKELKKLNKRISSSTVIESIIEEYKTKYGIDISKNVYTLGTLYYNTSHVISVLRKKGEIGGRAREQESTLREYIKLSRIGKLALKTAYNLLEKKFSIDISEIYNNVESDIGRKLTDYEKDIILDALNSSNVLEKIIVDGKIMYRSKIYKRITVKRAMNKLRHEGKELTIKNIINEISKEYGVEIYGNIYNAYLQYKLAELVIKLRPKR